MHNFSVVIPVLFCKLILLFYSLAARSGTFHIKSESTNCRDILARPYETHFRADSDIISLNHLSEAITGGLLYLRTRQVARGRYRMFPCDFSISQNCTQYFSSILRSFLGNWLFREYHQEGAWPSVVSFLPLEGPKFWHPFFMATDYNLFTTATTAFCLSYFDESGLPEEMKFIEQMKLKAFEAAKQYKSGLTYNFWTYNRKPGVPFPVSSPPNIPIFIVGLRWVIINAFNIWHFPPINESSLLYEWLKIIIKSPENSTGIYSLFNIPNDSDDNALANILYMRNGRKIASEYIDTTGIMIMSLYRDIDRLKKDRLNSAIGTNTGAFLTWHKDENHPVFSNPESGTIPFGTNNVDLVINANVLLALTLAGLNEIPGYQSAINLIARASEDKLWKKERIYYPEKLWFPYAVSRLVREGGLSEATLNSVLPKILVDLMEEQYLYESAHPELEGAFPPSDSVSRVLSTALGLNVLLNLGRQHAEKAGVADRYDNLIHKSLVFLLKNRHTHPLKSIRGFEKNILYHWPSGPLFSSSIHELAHWYSNSLTTSLVLEAFTKYILGFAHNPSLGLSDRMPLVFENRQLSVKKLYSP